MIKSLHKRIQALENINPVRVSLVMRTDSKTGIITIGEHSFPNQQAFERWKADQTGYHSKRILHFIV